MSYFVYIARERSWFRASRLKVGRVVGSNPSAPTREDLVN